MEQIWFIPVIITLIATAIFAGAALTGDSIKAPKQNYFPINKMQLIPLAAIVILYIPLAYWQLGSTDTPGSFAKFTEGSLTLTVSDEQSLPDYVDVAYFCGIGTGTYTIDIYNGEEWYNYATWSQNYAEILKWHKASSLGGGSSIKAIRIIADNPQMQLGEISLRDEHGNNLSVIYDANSAALVDEPDCPVDTEDWMYNAYFDEIYHPRTALENIEKITPFEISHPPLGKILLSIGIRIFGMNPFGWRFIGTLFGVLMLIPIYLLVQNMFGRTLVSICATVLFALDFMHYVQTRIATIDTEAVFFIILMFYFMYRWFVMETDAPLKKSLPILALCGISFGLGAATKWICIYGGLGLAWLWIVKLIRIVKTPKASFAPPPVSAGEAMISGKKPRVKINPTVAGAKVQRKLIKDIVLYSVLFFAVVPIVIYCLSYIPYAQANYGAYGSNHTLGGYLKMVWDNQTSMLHYHGSLGASHPYASQWWKWLFDIKPILYFQWFKSDGTKSVFGAFTNPFVTWAGLVAIVLMIVYAFKRKDRIAHFIVAGYLAQLLPWVFISRIAFAYHYFPDVVFLTLAIAYIFNDILRRSELKYKSVQANASMTIGSKALVVGFTVFSAALFVLFFPALSGKTMSNAYSHLLQWFRTYPF